MKQNSRSKDGSLNKWLLKFREDDLNVIGEKQLKDVNITQESYKKLFNQGLELIRRERLPKALLLEILDQYAARLEELQGVDLSVENIDNHDYATREKIKSLVLFGIQSVLINENSQLIAELKQSNKNYEELIGLITHEFKNMLTSIYGYNKILKRQLEKEGVFETSELITTIEKLTHKLFNMIDSLLKMSLSDKGILEPQKKVIDISADVLLPVLHDLKPMLIKKRVTVREKLKPEKIVLNADNDLLQMVFRNLIENGIKYGRESSEIIVDITADNNNNKIIIKISNEGIGIPETIKHDLFNKFTHASVGTNKSGTGIGLYNVKNIIDNHRGTISFKSEYDKQTVFTLTIPIQ